MTSLLRNPTGFTLFCILAATTILLPALFLHKFSLAITGLIVLGLASLLFTRPLYALLAYVILIPFEELAVFASLGTPTRLAGLLFFATYLFHRRFQINLRVMPLAAWLWLGWLTASLIWSPVLNWAYYFQGVQLFLATLLIADYLSRAPEKLYLILNGYTLSASIGAVLGIYNFFLGIGNASGLSGYNRTSTVEAQGVENFAFALIPAFLFSFYRVITTKRLGTRWLYISLATLLGVAMVLSGTRGAWLATLGSLLLVYIPRLKLRQLLIVTVAVVLSIAIASRIPFVTEFASYRSQDIISSGGAGRISIWLVSWQMYLDHPVVGIGWRMTEFAMSLQDFDSVKQDIIWTSDYGRFNPRLSHNIYLQTLLELGLIGFILYISWLGSLILPLAKRDPFLYNERTLALAILVAMLVGGMTNPEFHRKYYWLAIALAQGVRYYWLHLEANRYKGVKPS
jgi:O-antigen ligase